MKTDFDLVQESWAAEVRMSKYRECLAASDRSRGQRRECPEFSNSSQDREYGFIPPRLTSLEI